LSSDHNQRLGFGFEKRQKGTREFDSFRKSRQTTSKRTLREINISDARNQLLSTGKIDEVLGLLGGGKEATVLLARENNCGDYVCVKVFRYFTSTIRKRLRGTRHLLADDMASIAARQEYWNLHEMYNTGIPVPKPRYLLGSIVVMDYIAAEQEEMTPAPLLREIDLDCGYDPEECLYESIDILADIFIKSKFVHGDYSEHNLMMTKNGLVTMDVSQSVQYNTNTFIETPIRIRIDRAISILETDLYNINQHFHKKYRLSLNTSEIKQRIIEELPDKLKGFIKAKTIEIRPASMMSARTYLAKQAYWNETVQKRTGRKKQKLK